MFSSDSADTRPGTPRTRVSNAGAFQHRRIHPQEDVAPNDAAVDHCTVGHQHIVTQLQVVVGVQYTVVLDGAVFADYDLTVVAANYCSRPNAGAFTDGHVSYYVGCLTDEY